ncbi:LuxR C-terminal-related transcriptional regulator [Streptomyces sp. NPDC093546]|uniref:helix-turn-helix transcriptional regulator n=1 Tax=Streptomyces sp. NPDC093546 TaxID=3366040 RepID=UPI003804A7F0
MTGIYGRSAELDAVGDLLDRVRSGHGGALLVAAEPGLGRTALLHRAADGFTGGGRVVRVRAVAAERGVPHSGVHALLSAAGVRGTADVLRTGLEPDRLAELLRGAAGEARSLLVCVDDAHLWDTPSRAALGFAARRPESLRGVGLLLSVAAHRAQDPEYAGVPVVRLAPLEDRAVAALVDELLDGSACESAGGVAGGGADPAVREELLRELRYEAEGNPALIAAVVEGLTPAQRTGDAPLPRPLADGGVLLRTFGGRLAGLPPETRFTLLLAAAAQEPAPGAAGADAAVVLRAARAAGIGSEALDAAEAAGVVVGRVEGAIRFESALLRRTVLAGAPLSRRRAAHALLAAALGGEDHRLSHLLHLAFAAEGPDASLAAALEEAAKVEGSPLERSWALARAAELGGDGAGRAARLTAAAELAGAAGVPRRARELLAAARQAAHEGVRGRAELVRGTLALYDGPVGDAHAELLVAAELLGPYDPERALAARLAAVEAGWAMGDMAACLAALGGDGGPPARLRGEPGASYDYRLGLYAALCGRLDRAREPLRRVLRRAVGDDDPVRLLRAGAAALVLGDSAAACRAGARALALARARGMATLVPRVLEHLAYAELRGGRHALARAHARQGLRGAHRAGLGNVVAHQHAVLALVASVEGDAGAVAHHVGHALAIARPHGLAQAATLAEWAAARADLGRGRVAEAAARLGPLVRPGPRRGHFGVRMLAVPCFVEAAVPAGLCEDARAAAEEFAVWAALGADAQAPAQLARCRALLAPESEEADVVFREALRRHEEAGGDFETARTLLLYGKWLRRRRRPREARGRLRDALVAFERCGARPWAEQTRAELRATGEALGSRREPDGVLPVLTPQQLRIARCVAEGATNREVAAWLSISPRTVDHHLRNVFALLQVRSRVELSRLMDRADGTGAADRLV